MTEKTLKFFLVNGNPVPNSTPLLTIDFNGNYAIAGIYPYGHALNGIKRSVWRYVENGNIGKPLKEVPVMFSELTNVKGDYKA